MEESLKVNNNIIIENRKKFTLSGIKDVISFDDETVMLNSTLGSLVIKGMGLHIQSFICETGDLTGEGRINAIIYTAEEQSSGFFSKLFR